MSSSTSNNRTQVLWVQREDMLLSGHDKSRDHASPYGPKKIGITMTLRSFGGMIACNLRDAESDMIAKCRVLHYRGAFLSNQRQ